MISFSGIFSALGIGIPLPYSNLISNMKLAGYFFKFDEI